MVTVTLPSVPTPTLGPLPGESIATAGALGPSTYSEPFRLTSWFEEGVWLKFTATQTGTLLADTLLTVKSAQVVSRGDSEYVCDIYTGPSGATTMGELRHYNSVSEGSTYLDVTAGDHFYFNFVVTDTDEERPQFGRPVPWYVVLRISAYDAYTDWIDPPANGVIWHDASDIEIEGYGTNPTSGRSVAWNGDNLNYTYATTYFATTNSFGGHSVMVGSWKNVDPGTVPAAYECAWNRARLRYDPVTNYWSPNGNFSRGPAPTDWWGPVGGTCQPVDTSPTWNISGLDQVGWWVEHTSPDPVFDWWGSVRFRVWATSYSVSLIAALDLMGPEGGFDLDDAYNVVWAAGRAINFGAGLITEDERPELLGVSIQPQEGTPVAISADTATLGTLEWRAGVSRMSGYPNATWDPYSAATTDWGPVSNYGGDFIYATSWAEGSGGPADLDATSVCTYSGGTAGWTDVPDAVWEAALETEMALYTVRKAGGSTLPWRNVFGLDLICLPDGIDGSAPITSVAADSSTSVGRRHPSVGVRLYVKPSRFKLAILPEIAAVTPTYPEDIPATGAVGDGRRTFGRPEST